MIESPLLCPVPSLFFLHLSCMWHLKQASVAGQERGTGFFRLSPNPSIPGTEQRAKAGGETAAQRVFVSCLAGFSQAPSLPQGPAQHLLKWGGQRETRDGQVWLPVLHNISAPLALCGAERPVRAGAGSSTLGFSGWCLRSVLLLQRPSDHYLTPKSPVAWDRC